MSGRTGLALLLAAAAGCGPPPKSLRVYCAAGLRPPMAELADAFGKRHGVTVECDYAGSEVLLTRLRHSRRGDLYLPGDSHYADQAAAEGFVASRVEAAWWAPVILVKKGNPRDVRSLRDFLRPGLRVCLGDPKACAIGRVSEELFRKNDLDAAALEKNVVYRGLTVNDLGLQVKVGPADAAVVWDAIARQFAGDTEIVTIPVGQNVISSVPLATLTCSQNPELAARFLEFAKSEDGRRIFERHGYATSRP